MSDEDDEKVSGYLDDLGITVRVAAGSTCKTDYGVNGIPDAVLIGADGVIAWRGHPGNLVKGEIEDALKGARKPPKTPWLAFRPSLEPTGALQGAVEATTEGELRKALAEARKVADDEEAAAADRASAETLAREIEEHGTLLSAQAAAMIARRDVLKAVDVYDALSKELKGSRPGDEAKERLNEIKKDPELQNEAKAAEALTKLHKSVARLSSSKQRGKYKEFAEKYKGTRAGDTARSKARTDS